MAKFDLLFFCNPIREYCKDAFFKTTNIKLDLSKTMAFRGKIVVLLFVVLCSEQLMSQTHLAPMSGTDGIAGAVVNSFVIKWSEESGAVDYEYVMSNNRACFETCPGDTRQRKTTGDTTATEMNLIADRWYYWITRVIYENGKVSDWSAISNFFTKTPPSKGIVAQIAPNPVKDKRLSILIDWAININAKSLTLYIFNINGHEVIAPFQIEKKVGRFQQETFPLLFLPSGSYFIRVVVNKENNEGAGQIILKMIVL